MSELTGSPGNSCSGVKAPISQSGIERAKTNRKKIKGDLLIDVLVFMILRLPFPCEATQRPKLSGDG